jgi:hypothetical protein
MLDNTANDTDTNLAQCLSRGLYTEKADGRNEKQKQQKQITIEASQIFLGCDKAVELKKGKRMLIAYQKKVITQK